MLPEWPVALVDWHSANALLEWKSERDGRAYRLPNELEWEKAARGVDGRVFPWGYEPEATWACILGSTRATPSRTVVQSFPIDESPYGVRGMTGNVRDWCINVWRHDGPPVHDGVLEIDPAHPSDPGLRVLRGGCWSTVPVFARAAGRFGGPPDERFSLLGFRCVRALGR
jgi:serine/threonine-protein kinase